MPPLDLVAPATPRDGSGLVLGILAVGAVLGGGGLLALRRRAARPARMPRVQPVPRAPAPAFAASPPPSRASPPAVARPAPSPPRAVAPPRATAHPPPRPADPPAARPPSLTPPRVPPRSVEPPAPVPPPARMPPAPATPPARAAPAPSPSRAPAVPAPPPPSRVTGARAEGLADGRAAVGLTRAAVLAYLLADAGPMDPGSEVVRLAPGAARAAGGKGCAYARGYLEGWYAKALGREVTVDDERCDPSGCTLRVRWG